MKRLAALWLIFFVAVAFQPFAASGADLISRKTETGTIVGYKDSPLMPWTNNKYCVHDPDRPIPKVVVPRPVGSPLPLAAAPSDAIVLFGANTEERNTEERNTEERNTEERNTEQWKDSSWQVKDGLLCAGHESLETKQPFGDCQLHIEFATPTELSSDFMNRGNSGVIIMGKYEVQIFDSWHEHPQQIYSDGQAASIYGQTPPLVNACMPPGEWQAYDIVFTAPVFKDGKLALPAFITLYHNGVLVHHHQAVMGEMAHRTITPYKPHAAKLPLVLQGHGSSLHFRNIWIREL